MSTFYKYAERNVENRVDWGTIGKEFTDMLKDEATLRETKKADIEKATNETLKSLADAPTGLDKGVNENILNFSAQSQDYLLMMNRLLKSGQLDPKDFSIYTQNLKSGTGKVFSAAKAYQENYAKNIERANAKGLKRASAEELWNRTQAEDAANFSKSQLYINNNGNVSVGLPTRDPATGQYVLNNDPNTYKTPEQLHYASSVDIDPYDVDGTIKGIVDTFGKNVIAEAKLHNRFVVSVDDVTKRPGYKEAEDNFIKGALAGNSSYGASILTDWINSEEGKQYGYTSNPNDPKIKTGEKILMTADPANPTSGRMIPQLNPEQEARAESFMKQRLRFALDKEIKVQYQEPQQQTSAGYEHNDKIKNSIVLGQSLGKLISGDNVSAEQGATFLRGIDGVESVTKSGDELIVVKDGKRIPFKLTANGQLANPRDAVTSLISTFNPDGRYSDADVLKAAMSEVGKRGVNVNTSLSVSKESTTPNYKQALNKKISTLGAEVFPVVNGKRVIEEGPVVEKLTSTYGTLIKGLSFDTAGVGNNVKVTYDPQIDGFEPITTTLSLDELGSKKFTEALNRWILTTAKPNDKALQSMYESGVLQVGGGNTKKSTPTVTGGKVR